MIFSKSTLESLPALITRVIVGFVFAFGAWAKFQNIDQVISQFTQTGLPLVAPLTYLVCTIELLGGLFLMLGLFTRFVTVPLILIEAVAIFTVKAQFITTLAATLNFTECLYIMLFFWLLIKGPGRFSFDYIWFKKIA